MRSNHSGNVSCSALTTTDWSHLFEIHGYTYTKKLGRYLRVKSDRFPAGGHSWRIIVYLDTSDPAGLVHLKLRLTCGDHMTQPFSATVRLTLLPRVSGGEPLTLLTHTFQSRWENPWVDMKREDLERYYVRDDDSLPIHCDVRFIQTISSRSPPARPSRIKTAWLEFTRRLLPAACTTHADHARPLAQQRAVAPPAPLTPAVTAVAKLGCLAAEGRRLPSEKLVCAICLEVLEHGDKCRSQVPACHPLFHRDCIDVWMKTKTTCPLCRRPIVAGSERVVSAADDMV